MGWGSPAAIGASMQKIRKNYLFTGEGASDEYTRIGTLMHNKLPIKILYIIMGDI